jgi:hypothetical protein
MTSSLTRGKPRACSALPRGGDEPLTAPRRGCKRLSRPPPGKARFAIAEANLKFTELIEAHHGISISGGLRPGRVASRRSGGACRKTALLPPPNRQLALAHRSRSGHHPHRVSRQQHGSAKVLFMPPESHAGGSLGSFVRRSTSHGRVGSRNGRDDCAFPGAPDKCTLRSQTDNFVQFLLNYECTRLVF